MPGTVDCSWIDVPWRFPFTRYDIDIWYGISAELHDHYDSCFDVLNDKEKQKGLRFHRLADRNRYVLQHGYLRKLLGERLAIPARELSFGIGENDKPYLIGHEVSFNLSNSWGNFLIAIGDEELGVDIEFVNKHIGFADIAANYFGRDEMGYIERAAEPAKAFFLLWTRKEALLKACSMGIDDDLPNVPALDGQHNLPARYPVKQWSTRSFCTDGGYMMSVTCPDASAEINLQRIGDHSFKNGSDK